MGKGIEVVGVRGIDECLPHLFGPSVFPTQQDE
jgi:hypothetical protein